MAIWLARLMKLLRGTRYTVMVHDIYPDVIVANGLGSDAHPTVQLWRWLNRGAYESAASVITLGQHMADVLSSQFDARRTVDGMVRVVPPWADTDVLRPLPKQDNWFARKHGQVDKITIMYSGNMGLGHDLETVMEVAEQLADDDRFHFVLIGAGPKWEWLNRTQSAKRLTNVTILGWQPESVVPYSLAAADLALVSLEPELTGLAVPSKAYAFLAVGTPLAVLCDAHCELADLVREFDCGVRVPPQSPATLSQIILNEVQPGGQLNRWKAGALNARSRFPRERGSQQVVSIAACQALPADFCSTTSYQN